MDWIQFRNLFCAMAVLAGTLCGCSSWDLAKNWKSDHWHSNDSTTSEGGTIALPRNRMNPDAVVLEVAVGQLDQDQIAEVKQLWQEIDQQAIPLADRQRLDANGIQAGIASTRVPAVLNRLLEDKPINKQDLQTWQIEYIESRKQTSVSRMILHERIQNRKGEKHSVPVSDRLPTASWVVRFGDRQSAGQGEQVRGFFQFRTYPRGDGGVRLVVVPEIRHGEVQARYGVAEGAFRYSAEQPRRMVNELKFEVVLRPGETLILGPASRTDSLGAMMMRARPSANFDQRLLLVRLVQSQRDDLFESRRDNMER